MMQVPNSDKLRKGFINHQLAIVNYESLKEVDMLKVRFFVNEPNGKP